LGAPLSLPNCCFAVFGGSSGNVGFASATPRARPSDWPNGPRSLFVCLRSSADRRVLDYDSDDFHASTAVHGLAQPHGGEWKRRKHEAASASSNMQYAGKDGGYSHQPNGMTDPWALVSARHCLSV
jgi:hypothetical protein